MMQFNGSSSYWILTELNMLMRSYEKPDTWGPNPFLTAFTNRTGTKSNQSKVFPSIIVFLYNV